MYEPKFKTGDYVYNQTFKNIYKITDVYQSEVGAQASLCKYRYKYRYKYGYNNTGWGYCYQDDKGFVLFSRMFQLENCV